MYPNNVYPQQQVPTVTVASNEGQPARGFGTFTIIQEGEKDRSSLPVPLPNGDIVEATPKKKRGRPRKDTVNPNEIVTGESEVEAPSTSYTYQETTEMLRGTIAQLDELSFQIRQELDNVRASRTMRRKEDFIIGLSGNLGQLISTKISAIREINASITKANDMDYKKAKDMKTAEASVNDDRYIMDLYNSIIHNGMGGNNIPNIQQNAGIQPGLVLESSIITGDPNDSFAAPFVPDDGYLSYLANMTPEQNLMRYENNPNVKQVVVYDKATGNRAFQVMDMSTGQIIPNVPVRSEMFLADTTIDLEHKIAKNVNLKETYPLVVINDGVVNEY